MACQVGITTDPERRKQEWPPTCGTGRSSKGTKAPAPPSREKWKKQGGAGCNHGGGGGQEIANWYVYRFTY